MSTTIDILNTGVLMGIIHVLTGPDHLSALATLSGTSVSSQTFLKSFLLGTKWGLGHSLGLLVVGSILIAMEEGSNEWIGMDPEMKSIIDTFVGVFMLALGCYGLHKACRHRREADAEEMSITRRLQEEESIIKKNTEMSFDHRRQSVDLMNQMSEVLNRDGDEMRASKNGSGRGRGLNQDNDQGEMDMDDIEQRILNAAQSLRRNSDNSNDEAGDKEFMMRSLKASAKGALSKSFMSILTTDRPASTMRATSFVHDHAAPQNSIAMDSHSIKSTKIQCGSYFDMSTSGVLAIIAGIVHGVAGPGGVLGVIPAVQLRNARLASIYLSAFCVTSTLVMGGFAAFYGRFSEWLVGGQGGRSPGKRVFVVEVGSAFLSLAVGIVWLVLSSIGELDDIFP